LDGFQLGPKIFNFFRSNSVPLQSISGNEFSIFNLGFPHYSQKAPRNSTLLTKRTHLLTLEVRSHCEIEVRPLGPYPSCWLFGWVLLWDWNETVETVSQLFTIWWSLIPILNWDCWDWCQL